MTNSHSLARFVANRKLVGLTLAILSAGAVTAAVVFTQQFPSVPVTGPEAFCDALTASPASVSLGSSGFVIFYCLGASSQVEPAFHTPANAVLAPTFSLPSPWTNLDVFPAGDAAGVGQSCSAVYSNARALVSGSAVTFPASAGDWNYCADYTNAPLGALPSFSVSWDTAPGSVTTKPVMTFGAVTLSGGNASFFIAAVSQSLPTSYFRIVLEVNTVVSSSSAIAPSGSSASVSVGGTTFLLGWVDVGSEGTLTAGDRFKITGDGVSLPSGADFRFYVLWAADGSVIQTASFSAA